MKIRIVRSCGDGLWPVPGAELCLQINNLYNSALRIISSAC